MKNTCDFNGFTFTGSNGRTYGYDAIGTPCTKPLDITVPNTGKPNIFVNWTPSQGNFNNANINNFPTIKLPNLDITSNRPIPKKVLKEIELIGNLHNKANILSEFIEQYENEPWQKVVKKERIFGIKAFTNKKTSHVKPHAVQVEQAKLDLKSIQDNIAKLTVSIGSFSESKSLDDTHSNSTANVFDLLEQTMQLQSKGSGSYDFSNQKMGYQGVDHLLYGKSHIYLKAGDGYQGALAKKYTVVTKLNLSNCDIGSLGGGAIASALYYNQNNSLVSLVHLDLSNNDMCDVITYPFGRFDYPCPSPSLRILNLSNNKITDNGVAALSRGLEHNRLYYLKYLDVSGNHITDAGKGKLAIAANKASNISLAITLEKHNDANGVWNFIKKAFHFYAEEHAAKLAKDGKVALAVYGDNDWASCKKLIHDSGKDMSMGIVKHSSNVIAQQLIQKAPPQVKGATIGVVFVAAGVDAVQAVDVENLGYCLSAVNDYLQGGDYYNPNTTHFSPELIGSNGEHEDF